jgi:phosphocarrier protein HPr
MISSAHQRRILVTVLVDGARRLGGALTSLKEEMAMPDGTSTQTGEDYGTRTVVVTNRHGLHARPCSAIVNTVGRHQANVTIQKSSQAVDASSVLDLMTLAATQGTELVISATGPEAAEALETLVRLFADEFGVAYTE